MYVCKLDGRLCLGVRFARDQMSFEPNVGVKCLHLGSFSDPGRGKTSGGQMRTNRAFTSAPWLAKYKITDFSVPVSAVALSARLSYGAFLPSVEYRVFSRGNPYFIPSLVHRIAGRHKLGDYLLSK